MKIEELDYVMVPVGMMVLLSYHAWLLYTIICHPSRTVIGLNAQTRYQWILFMMSVSTLSHSLSLCFPVFVSWHLTVLLDFNFILNSDRGTSVVAVGLRSDTLDFNFDILIFKKLIKIFVEIWTFNLDPTTTNICWLLKYVDFQLRSFIFRYLLIEF
jgi:hypothetical protein